MSKKDEGIVKGPRPLRVCRICGPQALFYAGPVLYVVCSDCAALLRRDDRA